MSKSARNPKALTASLRAGLLQVLKERFEQRPRAHPDIEWSKLSARLEANRAKLWSLQEMERTGGEPDVVGYDETTDEYVFFDCSLQSPTGRRSLCYDREALERRKEHKPAGSALELAAAMGVEMLSEDEYLELQKRAEFDTKSSSWLKTPAKMRQLGGALYGTRSYGRVLLGANGAESYFGGRGFRASLRV